MLSIGVKSISVFIHRNLNDEQIFPSTFFVFDRSKNENW